jgi:hypothetical protein
MFTRAVLFFNPFGPFSEKIRRPLLGKHFIRRPFDRIRRPKNIIKYTIIKSICTIIQLR